MSLFVVLFNVFDVTSFWKIEDEATEFKVRSKAILLKYREYSKDSIGNDDESTVQDDSSKSGIENSPSSRSSSSSCGFVESLGK